MSSILLGVRDMDRPKRFHPEGSGWKVERDYGVLVFFDEITADAKKARRHDPQVRRRHAVGRVRRFVCGP